MSSSSDSDIRLSAAFASRLAGIALSHVRREYPNKLDHVLGGPEDAETPQKLHPLFYGSFDWHSCVHSYWLLATLFRLQPEVPEAPRIRDLFESALSEDHVARECAYLERPSARLFERPYGWTWLLMLQAELMRHDRPDGRRWAERLRPLADAFVRRFRDYLPKATYPIRSGAHANTAFALTLAEEYAQTADDQSFRELIVATARRWYERDEDCQAWEPSGEDFLSPALVEAACMAGILLPAGFDAWLQRFLPRLAQGLPQTLFEPVTVTDRTDGRIVHLDGLNLSRAWCWRRIVRSLPASDPLRDIAAGAAERHLAAALPHLTGHYMGEHWLATYALLALL